jgi:hypothetical protein
MTLSAMELLLRLREYIKVRLADMALLKVAYRTRAENFEEVSKVNGSSLDSIVTTFIDNSRLAVAKWSGFSKTFIKDISVRFS